MKSIENWKKFICSGNSHFNREEYFDARKHYCQAISLCNRELIAHAVSEEAVWATLVSYENLADVYLKQTKAAQAFHLLQDLYEILQERSLPEESSQLHHDTAAIAIARGKNKIYNRLILLSKRLNIEIPTPQKTTTQSSAVKTKAVLTLNAKDRSLESYMQ